MYRKTVLLSLLVMLMSHLAIAQRTTITGTVVDTTGAPLVSASTVLLQPEDSTLIGFGLTNDEGLFRIARIEAGDYIAQITYVGYGTVGKLVTIKAEEAQEDLGRITMYSSTNQLTEVTVRAEFIPIVLKKDTIEYNADAFKVKPNANVEELLRQLPGVEVEDDGSISVQGEEVKRVTVDGKKFFGDDPKKATRNLPADAVKKVQVIDRKSDKAAFTGVDDGEREKEVNLELKDDKKQGLFGEITGGIGADQNDSRYESKLNLNRFTKNWQLSALGSYNNINEEFFGFNDSYGIRHGGGRNQPGITSTLGAGLNAVYSKGKELEISTSYFFSDVGTDLINRSEQTFFRNEGAYDVDNDDISTSGSINHSIETELEWKPDTLNRLQVEASFDSDNNTISASKNSITSVNDRLVSELIQTRSGNNDQADIDLSLEYTRRLKKAGRSITTNLALGQSDEADELFLDQRNLFENGPMAGRDSLILQDQIADLDNGSYSVRVSYTEPINDRTYLYLNVRHSNRNNTSLRQFFDIDPMDQTVQSLNEALSTTFDNSYTYNWGGLQLQRNYDALKVTAGVDYKISNISGEIVGAPEVDNNFQFVLPRLVFNWDKKRIRLAYVTSVQEPSIRQLSPIVDNTDPTNIYSGNPDLRPEYSHRLSARWYFWDSFTFRNMFVNGRITYTSNNIVTSRIVDENLIRRSTPLNVDEQVQANFNLSYGQPIRPLRVKARVSTGYSYSQGINFINGIESDVTTTAPTVRFRLENLDNEVISVRLSSRLRWNRNSYSSSSIDNQQLLNQSHKADVILDFGKGWTLDQELTYSIFSQEQTDSTEDYVLWNATLQKSLMNDRLAIRLRAFDLLEQNQAIIQSTGADFVSESIGNTLTRYGMLSVVYKLSDFNPQRGFRVVRM